MSPTVFIIGASRGIGRGLVDTFLRAGWDVHATVRSTNVTLPPSVVTHVLDVENDEQIEQVANNVYGNPIDLLIHNAGVKPSDKISNDQCLNINTEGPFRVLKAFMKSITQPESQKKVCIITSQLGSREKFGGGKTPRDTYGKSKCYLNDKFRKMEPAWRENGVKSIVLHPGWVQTDMGGNSAPTTIQESCEGIYKVCVTMTIDCCGKFYTFEGKEHPW
eukprot:g1576.t1